MDEISTWTHKEAYWELARRYNVERRLLESDERSAGYPPSFRDEFLDSVAIADAASVFVKELLEIAMDVAAAGYVLGRSDGDGDGGIYHVWLSAAVDARLYPNGRPDPPPVARSKPQLSPMVRGRVLQRDGDTCQRCGATKNLSVDHIVPVSRGGSNDLANLQVLCVSCNSRKGVSVIG